MSGWSEDEAPAYDPALTPAQCRKRAMDALARREHTREELTRKLARAGFDPAVVDAALTRLAEEGLQCDERFAEAFVASRYRQGKGPVRIRAELGRRGLDRHSVDRALAQANFDWTERAIEVRRQRFGDTPPEDLRDRVKQQRFLAYRGFDSEQSRAALQSAD